MTMSSSTMAEHDHDTQPLLRRDRSSEIPQRGATSLLSLLDYKPIPSVSPEHSSPSLQSSFDTESTLQTDDLVEPDDEGSRFSESLLKIFGRNGGKGRALEPDMDACATKRSVFDDDILAKHYWPKEDYEGFERFDVSARWTLREEKVRLTPLQGFSSPVLSKWRCWGIVLGAGTEDRLACDALGGSDVCFVEHGSK